MLHLLLLNWSGTLKSDQKWTSILLFFAICPTLLVWVRGTKSCEYQVSMPHLKVQSRTDSKQMVKYA